MSFDDIPMILAVLTFKTVIYNERYIVVSLFSVLAAAAGAHIIPGKRLVLALSEGRIEHIFWY